MIDNNYFKDIKKGRTSFEDLYNSLENFKKRQKVLEWMYEYYNENDIEFGENPLEHFKAQNFQDQKRILDVYSKSLAYQSWEFNKALENLKNNIYKSFSFIDRFLNKFKANNDN